MLNTSQLTEWPGAPLMWEYGEVSYTQAWDCGHCYFYTAHSNCARINPASKGLSKATHSQVRQNGMKNEKRV